MHVSSDQMKRFISDSLAPHERRRILSHLLGGCAECQETAREFWAGHSRSNGAGAPAAEPRAAARLEPADAKPTSGIDSTVWQSALDKATAHAHRLECERAAAPALAEQLGSQPLNRRLFVIRNQARYHSWALCEEFLERSWDSRFDDPMTTLAEAETAQAIAECLDETEYGTATWDLRSRATAYVASALMISSDFRASDRILDEAEQLLERGTGDPLEMATILGFRASLRVRQKRFDEALQLAERRISLSRRFAQSQKLGEAFAYRALVYGHLEENAKAIRDLERSLEYLDPAIDARSALASRHNLIVLLHAEGRLREALERLRETRPIYHQLGDRLNLLRLRQMEGEIAASLGETLVAEQCFLEARNGLMAAGIATEAAELSLQLAELYLSHGRFRETRQLAEQLLPIFQSRDLHTEAIAALLLFREAVHSETVTVHMVRETLHFMQNLHSAQASNA